MINQLKAGVFLNYVIIFVNSITALFYTPFMLHKLGQNEYGIYSLVASVISYLTILDLGLGNAVIRYTSKYRALDNKKRECELLGMVFSFYCIISVIVALLGGLLFFNMDLIFAKTMTSTEISRAKIMFFCLILNLAFTFPLSIFSSAILAYERFVFQKGLNLTRLLLNTVVMVALLQMGYKAIALVISTSVFNIATLLINFFYCKYKLHIKMLFHRIDKNLAIEIAQYSLWILMNVIMDKIYWSSGQFIIGAYMGAKAISIFALAIHFQSTFMQFSTAITSLFLPKVTKLVTLSQDDKQVSDLFIKVGRIQFIVISYILAAYILLGKPFIILWAGDEYKDTYIVALMFLFSLFISLIQNLGITILQARNQMKFRSIVYLIISLVGLLMQILAVKKFGIIGCSIVISLCLILGQGLTMNIYYQVRQKLDIVGFWKEIIKMSICPLAIVLIFEFVTIAPPTNWTNFFLNAMLFSIIYIPLFFLFSMNKYERNLFLSPAKKLFRSVAKSST